MSFREDVALWWVYASKKLYLFKDFAVDAVSPKSAFSSFLIAKRADLVHILHYQESVSDMGEGEFKHLVVVKFKEGVVVEDLIKGMEKMVSEIDTVKSFEWGQDIESLDVLRQGFTHAFMMTFNKKEEFVAFQGHPNHVEFSTTFSAAIEKIVVLDFPATLAKPPPA